ncbi:MAG: hypothetical protein NW224_16575 [Leptolyngbyaceae cyanobacterium bins.302]|nr:hypothetical protein [Leptolyngbyaceae cyanobacterium bins.302]
MSYSLTEKQAQLLKECVALAQDIESHADADRRFLDLEETLAHDPATAEIVGALWRELLSARRSAAFWQQISDVERSMSEKLADNHFQLQQNYLRLMQEQ